jgi:hypothetical protein
MDSTQSIGLFEKFRPDLSSLVVGLVLFVVALLVNRWIQSKRQKKSYSSVLRSIYSDFKKNLDLLCQLHSYLFVEVVPSFSLELSRSAASVQNLAPVCLNFGLLDRISHGYYELRHIQERLDVVRGSFGSLEYDPRRRGTHALIHNDITIIFQILSEINTEIRENSDKSARVDPLADDYLTKKFEEFQKDPQLVAIAREKNINLSSRPMFDRPQPLPKTQASGNE